MMTDEPQSSAAEVPVQKNKGGRPRKAETIVINIRLPVAVYDRYCRCIARSRNPSGSVRSIMRDLLTRHAPAP